MARAGRSCSLHGWTMDRRVEMDTYERIFATRPRWRRIYPDLPGMGRSVAKAGLKNQDDMLAVLLQFIDRVLPSARFLLAGTSGGAYLARAVAARRRSAHRRPAAARARHHPRRHPSHGAVVPRRWCGTTR